MWTWSVLSPIPIEMKLEVNINNDDKDQITGAGQSNARLLTSDCFSFLATCFGLSTGHYQTNCRKTYTQEQDKYFINTGVLNWCATALDPYIRIMSIRWVFTHSCGALVLIMPLDFSFVNDSFCWSFVNAQNQWFQGTYT